VLVDENRTQHVSDGGMTHCTAQTEVHPRTTMIAAPATSANARVAGSSSRPRSHTPGRGSASSATASAAPDSGAGAEP
jgi:hypothetical protein